jgi:hypothetical protein
MSRRRVELVLSHGVYQRGKSSRPAIFIAAAIDVFDTFFKLSGSELLATTKIHTSSPSAPPYGRSIGCPVLETTALQQLDALVVVRSRQQARASLPPDVVHATILQQVHRAGRVAFPGDGRIIILREQISVCNEPTKTKLGHRVALVVRPASENLLCRRDPTPKGVRLVQAAQKYCFLDDPVAVRAVTLSFSQQDALQNTGKYEYLFAKVMVEDMRPDKTEIDTRPPEERSGPGWFNPTSHTGLHVVERSCNDQIKVLQDKKGLRCATEVRVCMV